MAENARHHDAGPSSPGRDGVVVHVVGAESALTRRIVAALSPAPRGGGVLRERRAAYGAEVRPRIDRTRVYLVNGLEPDGTTSPGKVQMLVQSTAREHPGGTVLVLLDERNAEAVRAARDAGAADYLGAGEAENPEALRWRMARVGGPEAELAWENGLGFTLSPLLQPDAGEVDEARRHVEALLAEAGAGTGPAPAAPPVQVTAPELRSPESGRFDARRIAERLGVPVSRLAALAGVSQQALSARPDSPRAQEALLPIARVLAAAAEALPGGRVPMWLHSPQQRFGGRTPLDLVLAGSAERLARELEAALEGLPD